MERASVGDRWAFGRPHQPFVTPRKRRVSGVAAMVSVLVMLAGFPAFADGIQGDADALATSAPSANGLNADQTIGGPAVLYDYSAVVENNNRTVDDVFAVSGDTVSATLSVTQDFSWPVSFDTEFTGTNAFTAYGQNKAGKLSVTVPSTATADQVNHIKVTITATASNGRALSPDKVELNYNITAKAPSAPANSAPVVTAPANQTADEGTSTSFNLGSFSDSGPSPWDVTVNWGDGTSDTSFQMTAAGIITAQSHTYADNGTYTVTVTVRDAGSPQLSDSKTFQVIVSNVAPTVVAGFTSPSVDCQNQATLNVNPDDLGVNDAPWKVNISWGDTTTEPEITRTNLDLFQVTHTYALADLYNATVSVTDKDADSGSDNTNSITVNQTYSMQ